jgi:hypothetical protein
VPALEIGRDLDFIDREKRHVEIPRHRFHGGDPEPRILRFDLLPVLVGPSTAVTPAPGARALASEGGEDEKAMF